MRLKSAVAGLLIGFATLGSIGCGSNSGDNSEFLATTADVQQAQTGNLTFNFVTAQAAYTVDANSANLRFEFFDGVNAAPIFTSTAAFNTAITVNGVPASATRVVITGFDGNNFPLYTINQAIDVEAGATTTISAISNAVAVQLNELRLVSGDLSDFQTGLNAINVAVGGTFQVFMVAEYDNGSTVLVGDNATYAVGSGIATVNAEGTVSGVSAGTTTFTAVFAGQTLNRPVTVSDGLTINFAGIAVENAQPIQVAAGTGVTLAVVADNLYGLTPADPRLSYSVDTAGFTVTNGVLNVAGLASGTTGILTVTYTNPDTTTITTTATVQAQ